MRSLLASFTFFALVVTVAGQDPPEVAGPPVPPAPPPLAASDVIGIWRIDGAATGQNMLASLKDVAPDQLEANKNFFAVVLEALKSSEYRFYPGGTYRARVGGETKIAPSRGTWTIDGNRLQLHQTHLANAEREETHLAEIRGGKIVFLPAEGGGTPSFVLARDPLTAAWVVDAAASEAAIEQQVAELPEADAGARRTALKSLLQSYRDARFEFAVDNRWRATLGTGENAVHLQGKWQTKDDRLRLVQTHSNDEPAPSKHEGTRADGKIVFADPDFTLVLVPAS